MSNILNIKEKFPKPISKYRVSVTGGDNWRKFHTARIGVSLGSKHLFGERLYSLAEWSSHRFNYVYIDIFDAPHVWNIGCEKVKVLANEWLAINKEPLDFFENIRVEKLTDAKLPNLEFNKSLLNELYIQDKHFRTALGADTVSWWYKKLYQDKSGKNKLALKSKLEFIESSKKYLIDELAYVISLGTGYLDIYPGDRPSCLIYLVCNGLLEFNKIGLLSVEYKENKNVL